MKLGRMFRGAGKPRARPSSIVMRIPGHRDIELISYYDQFLGYYETCEPQTKQWFVEHAHANWVILDCGANIGYYSILFSRLSPDGRVYAFEPTETAMMLVENLRHCRAQDNVEVVRCALGAKSGEFEDSIFRIWGGAPERRRYTFTTIDAFVAERGLTVDAIKIDVDSFDLEVLRGARQTLVEQDPFVMVELNHALSQRQQSVPQAFEFMVELGYKACESYDYDNFLFKRGAVAPAPGRELIVRFPARPEPTGGTEKL
jgi:FkbM family methyltransferase